MSETQELPSKEWEGQPGEDLHIPEEYAEKIRGLRYKIMVFIGRKPFEFQCTSFLYTDADHTYTFSDVMMDTSKRDPKGEITLQRLTYHPNIQLGSAPFMVIPLTSERQAD